MATAQSPADSGPPVADLSRAPGQPVGIDPPAGDDAALEAVAGSSPVAVDQQLFALDSLLNRLEPASTSAPPAPERTEENALVVGRLGIAGSLFVALRAKHAATAAHSVRVALGCSAWAQAMGLPAEECDALEVAALLHDLGKVGVPDRILLKPAPLVPDEHLIMDRHWQMGIDILASSCNVPEVLEIIRHTPAWFDGTRGRVDREGLKLPRTSRMLGIVDAFDSMTTAHVYRPAMSEETAIKELCGSAGTQFDPELVLNFAKLHSTDHHKLHHRVARRWLQELTSDSTTGWWQVRSAAPNASESEGPELYAQKLLENMYDAVIFLDANMQVMLWNRGAERLTGIAGSSMLQRPFTPGVLELRDDHGVSFSDDDCPVLYSVRTGVQSLRRLTIRGREGRDVMVDAHTIPVVGAEGATHGASVLLHDASGQASLEERCHSLYEQATRDPLTQLANRAEFDRVFSLFVNVHLERHLSCSLIICDIDHFKHVNDTYGHPAGDEAIKGFAQILKSSTRPGDLVARYGGEEFVILCADCTTAAAAARAEHLRKSFASLPIPALNGKSCSASFGVTEIQPGDSDETMLHRADRALLLAKEGGRNVVVQLGTGMRGQPESRRRRWWYWPSVPGGVLLDCHLSTNVPLNLSVEKLRGFVLDHQAEITATQDDRVVLALNPAKLKLMRRQSDRPFPVVVELDFTQRAVKTPSAAGVERGKFAQTCIHVIIRPRRSRDRRRAGAIEQAHRVLAGLKSYLMATEIASEPHDGVIKRASSLLHPWRGKNPH